MQHFRIIWRWAGLASLLALAGLSQPGLTQTKTQEVHAVPAQPPVKGQYEKLTFDLLKSWRYVEGKTPIPDFIQALNGRNVEMIGYMMPLNEIDDIKEFLLVPSLWGCCYGQPPSVSHIVAVKMLAGQTAKFNSGPIQIQGRFTVGETKQDGYLVSLYVLTVDKISRAKPPE